MYADAFVRTERWCEAVLRRVLSRRVSVEAMISYSAWTFASLLRRQEPESSM
jgi:hypothetical protein